MVILQYLDTTCCKRQYACSFRTIDVSDYALFGWSASAAGGAGRAGRAALPFPHRYSPHIPTICRSLRSLHLDSLHISTLSDSYSLDVYTLFTSMLSLSLSLCAYPLASLLSSHPYALQISVLSLSLTRISTPSHSYALQLFFSSHPQSLKCPLLYISVFFTLLLSFPNGLSEVPKKCVRAALTAAPAINTLQRHPAAAPCSGTSMPAPMRTRQQYFPSTAQQQRQHPRSKAHTPL